MVQPKGTRKATSPAPTLCRRQNKEPRRPVQGHTQLEIDTKPELWISVQCSFLFGDRGGELVCIRLQRRGVSGVDKAKVSNAANHVCLANNKFQGCESRRTSPSDRKHATFCLSLRQRKTLLLSQWPLLSDMCSTYPWEWKWAQIPSSEEVSTEASLQWSKQLAEWLQWVGSLVNRLNIIALLHTLNRTLFREWNGIL